MRRISDEELIGKRYGQLTIIGTSDKSSRYGHRYVVCRCDCGTVKEIALFHLTGGASKSCGCGISKAIIKRCTTHGDSGKRLYAIWRGIKNRCLNPNENCYPSYGGRGISICPEWMDYSIFKEWALNNGYQEDLTIDRIDVNGNYTPSNCRWIPFILQARNKRTNKIIEINGEKKLMIDWVKESPVYPSTVYDRIHKGWSIEDALFLTDQRFKKEN